MNNQQNQENIQISKSGRVVKPGGEREKIRCNHCGQEVRNGDHRRNGAGYLCGACEDLLLYWQDRFN